MSAHAPPPLPSQPAAAADAPWLDALRADGLALRDDPHGVQADPAARPGRDTGFVCALTDLGLLRVTGAEAVKFLHAQLTNDLEQLAPDAAQWTGYCTAKGRLLATALAWRRSAGDGTPVVFLLVPRPQAEALRKRLAMFVLRARARVEDLSDALALIGVGGAGALPGGPAAMTVADLAHATAIGLPAVGETGLARWLLVVPVAQAPATWQALRAGLPAAATAHWRWTEVLSGVPRIVAGAVEQFVPQMVNLDAAGGVSFRKGCYPGQEVVARSHYLGKLKRRMFAGALPAGSAVPLPGSDVHAIGGEAREPCGQVVLAAPAPEGGVAVLFESQIAAVEAAGVTIGGVPVAPAALPYAVPAAA